ncbi:MAG: hypothetical protein KME46_12770 [Brasilonema angustatum HA4187-MV1]|nr:hypothetical protein [Brasilonema angustatum HA4187-MV1]
MLSGLILNFWRGLFIPVFGILETQQAESDHSLERFLVALERLFTFDLLED